MILNALINAGRKGGVFAPSDDRAAGLWGVGETAAGKVVNEDTAMQISAFFCGVNLISATAGKVPLVTYKRTSKEAREPATDHPAYRLLKRSPNPEMSPSRFIKLLVQWAIVGGNGRAEIERDRRGVPINLWPIHPDRATTKRTADGRIVHVVYNNDGTTTTLPDADVLHHMRYSKDGVNGISTVGQARESLGLSVAANEYGAYFFKNSARPDVVLETPGPFRDVEARKALRKSWREAYGGKESQGVALLENGIVAKVLNMPNKDAQFLETRNFQVVETARWLNLPPHKLKELTRSTNNNIEHQALEFLTDTMEEYFIDIQQECDRKLIGDDERDTFFCEFLIDALLRSDVKSRNEALKIQRESGVINADEWRAKVNMNPLPNGEGQIYLMPLNHTTAKQMTRDEERSENGDDNGDDGSQDDRDDQNDNRSSGLMSDNIIEAARIIEQHKAGRLAEDNARNPVIKWTEGVRKSIAEAHKPLLADTIDRMLKIEARAVCRAANKPKEFNEWRDHFYAEHATKFRSAIIPQFEALGTAIRATSCDTVLDTEWDQAVGEWTKCATKDHIETAIGALTPYTDQVDEEFTQQIKEDILESQTDLAGARADAYVDLFLSMMHKRFDLDVPTGLNFN